MNDSRKKLIEVAMPLDVLNSASAREKSIRHGHPSTLHLWWARRPLAACIAVLFGQLVDDPSSNPERFPTREAQEKERRRLFGIIRDLVQWENLENESVLDRARKEIARSFARTVPDTPGAQKILSGDASTADIRAFLGREVPPLHDPFAGGGSIPIQAKRLGLRTFASDLNPIPVLLNAAMIDVPSRFGSVEPVGPPVPGLGRNLPMRGENRFAEDVLRYGWWVREIARQQVGELFGEDLTQDETKKGKVIAWIWARTVESPDPAFEGIQTPLISSFWLSKKKGNKAWVEIIKGDDGRSWTPLVHEGAPSDTQTVNAGTKISRGTFRCIFSGAPITAEYIRERCSNDGKLPVRLLAIVRDSSSGRRYETPSPQDEELANVEEPPTAPETELPEKALGFRVQNYGLLRHRDLFTNRQLQALVAFCDAVEACREKVIEDAIQAGWEDDGISFESGGSGATAYADAIALGVTLAISRRVERWAATCIWNTTGQKIETMVRLNALPMTWEFAEANPFSFSTGNFVGGLELTVKSLARAPVGPTAEVSQRDAATGWESGATRIVSTDPPYFDNVPYADLSDIFYVWLRRALRPVFPSLLGTLLVPKAAELVADPSRHGGPAEAQAFFESGMAEVFRHVASECVQDVPATIYYAFKQAEEFQDGISSTGWESFLGGLIEAGFEISATWPLRTERPGGLRNVGRNSLAGSILLACRPRDEASPAISRSRFRRELRDELPEALDLLEAGNIAPVDFAQAAIGPGMAIFSRHANVLEADGNPMSVRAALRMIFEVIDEIRGEMAAGFDRQTLFALTWFETFGFDTGPYGDAETLAKARNISVAAVQDSGVLHSGGGKVRLLGRDELPPWEGADAVVAWMTVQLLVRTLENEGEEEAAARLQSLGGTAETARKLAYRLYTVSERKNWNEEARAYNDLVIAWPDLVRLARESRASQEDLFEGA